MEDCDTKEFRNVKGNAAGFPAVKETRISAEPVEPFGLFGNTVQSLVADETVKLSEVTWPLMLNSTAVTVEVLLTSRKPAPDTTRAVFPSFDPEFGLKEEATGLA